MLNFFTEHFNIITYGFEILALLVGLFCFKKYKNTATKIFIFYLAYVVFVEQMGATFFYFKSFFITNFLRSIGFKSTAWYNFFWMFGSVVFVIYYIYNVSQSSRNKTILKSIVVLFTIIIVGHFFMNPTIFYKQHHPLYQLSGAFVILFSVALYLIEFSNSEKITDAFKNFSFYALSALFIWWIIVTPILLFDIYNTEADWEFVNLKRRIIVFANIFMYSCFAIGLIISKPQLDND